MKDYQYAEHISTWYKNMQNNQNYLLFSEKLLNKKTLELWDY